MTAIDNIRATRISAAARILSDQAADAYGVERADNWSLCSGIYMQDAERALAESLAHIDELTSALAECRDAMPIPAPGDARERAWSQAMSTPAAVPQYVKETVDAQAKQISEYKAIETALTARCASLSYAVDVNNAASAMLQSERNANATLTQQVKSQQAEIERLQRGEYICKKCGIRKDADHPAAHDF